VARADDLGRTLVGQVNAAAETGDLKFHQGLVLSWDSNTGANVVRIAGSDIANVQLLASAGAVVLSPGDPVMVLKYKSQYFIQGRVLTPGAPLAQPTWPIVMYPQFVPVGTIGNDFGYATVNASVLTRWEGRARISHPKIEVDGYWGSVTGGPGPVTYAMFVNNIEVGRWTVAGVGAPVVNHGSVLAGLSTGGFDVSAFIGQDWRGVRVNIISNGNTTGQTAFGILGCFFRQT